MNIEKSLKGLHIGDHFLHARHSFMLNNSVMTLINSVGHGETKISKTNGLNPLNCVCIVNNFYFLFLLIVDFEINKKN